MGLFTIVKPPGVTCPSWEPKAPGAKRCAHYGEGGACNHPLLDLDKCTEWQKANPSAGGASLAPTGAPHAPAAPARADTPAAGGPAPYGHGRAAEVMPEFALSPLPPLPARARHAPPSTVALTKATARIEGPPPFVPAKEIPLASIEALEALGFEMKLASPELGRDVWLVPAATGREDRLEVTFRDAATLRLLVDSFPGARVVELVKGSEPTIGADDDDAKEPATTTTDDLAFPHGAGDAGTTHSAFE